MEEWLYGLLVKLNNPLHFVWNLVMLFLMWPIRLVLYSWPGQLTVFLLEKTAQVFAVGFEAAVGRKPARTSNEGVPATNGARERRREGKLDKFSKTIRNTTPSDEGLLVRAAQIPARILRWLQSLLHSLRGKAPSTGTVKPTETDGGAGVVARKQSDKVGLVAWVYQSAIYALHPLNDLLLPYRLLVEYTKGVVNGYRNKLTVKPTETDGGGGVVAKKQSDKVGLIAWLYHSALYALHPLNDLLLAIRLLEYLYTYIKGIMPVYKNKSIRLVRKVVKKSVSPSEGAEFDAKDAGHTTKPSAQATSKSDAPRHVGRTKPSAQTTSVLFVFLRLEFLTWPIRRVLYTWPGQLSVFLLEKTAQVFADGIEAMVSWKMGTSVGVPATNGAKEGRRMLAEKTDKPEKMTIKNAKPRDEGYLIRAAQITVNILRWLQKWLSSLRVKAPSTGTAKPIETTDKEGVVARKRSDKVGLVAWLYQSARYVLHPLNNLMLVVGLLVEYTKGVINVYLIKSTVKPIKTDSGGGVAARKQVDKVGLMAWVYQSALYALYPLNDLVLPFRLLAEYTKGVINRFRNKSTVKPTETDGRGSVVARKQSDKMGLVTWVYQSALYALHPLNDLMLVVRLLEYLYMYIKGIIYKNKVSRRLHAVVEKSPFSPSEGMEFNANDVGNLVKFLTDKSDATSHAGPTTLLVQTLKLTPVPVLGNSPPEESTSPLSPTTLANSPLMIAPYGTTSFMRSPTPNISSPAGWSTASTSPRNVFAEISDQTDDSCKLEYKTQTSIEEGVCKINQKGHLASHTIKPRDVTLPASTAVLPALITQTPSFQGISSQSAGKTSTVVLSATVATNPTKAKTCVVSVQSVAKSLSDATAVNDEDRVLSKISADELDKVDIKTRPLSSEWLIIIDSECKKGQAEINKSGQIGGKELTKKALKNSPRMIKPPSSSTDVNPPTRGTDGSGPVPDSTADSPTQTSRLLHSKLPHSQLVYKTASLPSKLGQTTGKPANTTAVPASVKSSSSWATGKSRNGTSLLALTDMLTNPAGAPSKTALAKSTAGTTANSTENIPSDGNGKAVLDDPGKSGKQSKLKPWKKLTTPNK